MPVSPPSLRPKLVLRPPLQACATPHCVETCLLAGGSERPLSAITSFPLLGSRICWYSWCLCHTLKFGEGSGGPIPIRNPAPQSSGFSSVHFSGLHGLQTGHREQVESQLERERALQGEGPVGPRRPSTFGDLRVLGSLRKEGHVRSGQGQSYG